MTDVLKESFLYWSEEHFQSSATALTGSMREVFIKSNVSIERRVRLRMRTVIAQNVDSWKGLAYDNRMIKVAEMLTRHSSYHVHNSAGQSRRPDKTTGNADKPRINHSSLSRMIIYSRSEDLSELFPCKNKNIGGPTEPI